MDQTGTDPAHPGERCTCGQLIPVDYPLLCPVHRHPRPLRDPVYLIAAVIMIIILAWAVLKPST